MKLIESYISYVAIEDRVEHHKNFRCKYLGEYLSRNEYDISYLKLKSDNRLDDKHLLVRELISSVNNYSFRKLEDIKYSSKFKYSFKGQKEITKTEIKKQNSLDMHIDDIVILSNDSNDLISYYVNKLNTFKKDYQGLQDDLKMNEQSVIAYERIHNATIKNTHVKSSYKLTSKDEEKIINSIKNIHCLYKDIRSIITAITHSKSIGDDEKHLKKQNLKKAFETIMRKMNEIYRLKDKYPHISECIESLNDLRKKSKGDSLGSYMK